MEPVQLMPYNFFQNTECEYFPCHKVSPYSLRDFSCLFCFCPLYPDMQCGGHYVVLGNGVKDCSGCLLPHYNYDAVIGRLRGGSHED